MNNEMRMLETSKVPGTSVYNNAHEEIGAVDDLIVDTADRKGPLCNFEFRRISRDWQKSVCHSLDRT